MAESVDMFSVLPDALLLVIISLLPFKEAARTSILSKRWLRIWDQTSNIEFNEFFFVEFDQLFYIRRIQRNNFLNFIRHWIDNKKNKGNSTLVEKFSLKLSKPKEAREIIEKCVTFATKNGVKDLTLDFAHPDFDSVPNFSRPFWAPEEPLPTEDDKKNKFELPTHVYKHKSLESLKLFDCSLRETNLINWNMLKEISLGWMEVTQTLITTLLSNCKMIESLSLERCCSKGLYEFCGDNDLRLRRLIVRDCSSDGWGLFKIKAPNLVFFKYSGVMKLFEIQSSFAMEEADLYFALDLNLDDVGFSTYNLIQDLYLVKVLTVCIYILKILPSGPNPLRTERDMHAKHLIMKTSLGNDELLGGVFLLNSCPMLECLTLEIVPRTLLDYNTGRYADNKGNWKDNLITSHGCLASTLKMVEVNNFRGSMNELLVLHYIIRYGSVLEKVNVNVLKGKVNHYMVDYTPNYHAAYVEEFLMTTPRASSNLQISFTY